MPRKDKKSKKPKKPKVQLKIPKLKPPQLKPCLDCGYKTGSAFTVPFGYADRLGTTRLGYADRLGSMRLGMTTPVAPIVNINLGDYFPKPDLKKPIAKEISIQTEDALEYVKPVKKTKKTKKLASSDFEMEDIYNEPFLNVPKQPDLPSAVAEPFQYPSPFTGISSATLPLYEEPAAIYEGNKPSPMPRYRRSNVEIYTELLIQNGETPNNAMGLARSYPKEQLKEKIAQLKEALGKQKKV
jgi:hypothetical protein